VLLGIAALLIAMFALLYIATFEKSRHDRITAR
jgi:hypothetical protein